MQICDRCKKGTQTLIMSFFNTEMICDTCKTIERAHPDYKRAHDTETEAVLKGDYNFPGIGLPDDLARMSRPENDDADIKLIYEKCEDSISNELAAFKKKMLAMPQHQMYDQSLQIYCYEQTAYYMTEFLPSSGAEEISAVFGDEKIRRVVELCEQGKFIETIVTRLLNKDSVEYSNMDQVATFIVETLVK